MEFYKKLSVFILFVVMATAQRTRQNPQARLQQPLPQAQIQPVQQEVQQVQVFEDVRTPQDTTTKRATFLYEFDNQYDPPTLTWVPPNVNFSCEGKAPGYYADPDHKCQVYHLCMPDGRKYTMLCGVGTVFNQRTFVCDHWYSYPCANAERDYQLNNELWDQVLLPHSGFSPNSRGSRGDEDETSEEN